MARSYDVVVIGAGVFGAWTALRLEERGARVLLVDAYGPASSRSSSGGETRIIRAGYGADEIYTRWAMESLAAWQEFFRQTNQPLFFPAGVLWIARADHPRAKTTLETLKRAGVAHEWLTRSQIQQRWPQMRLESDEDGIFEPQSGGIAARRAVQAVVAEFERRGGTYRQARVEPPNEDAIWLDEIALGDGARVSAEQYVFACGAWMGKLFPRAIGARIFATRQEAFFFGAPAGDARFSMPLLPIWYRLDDEFYGFPDIEGRGVKIASDRHGPAHDPDGAERMATLEALGAARAALARILPDLAHAPMVESRVCQYENTPSGDFLIDRHPSLRNVWMVGGGSGHGFKHGPAMGRYVTRLVMESAEPEPRFGLAALGEMSQRKIR